MSYAIIPKLFCKPRNRWKYLNSNSRTCVGLLLSNVMSDWDQLVASVSAGRPEQGLWPPLLWEYTVVGWKTDAVYAKPRKSLCSLKTYHNTDLYMRTATATVLMLRTSAVCLYIPPFFFIFFISIFHLQSQHHQHHYHPALLCCSPSFSHCILISLHIWQE